MNEERPWDKRALATKDVALEERTLESLANMGSSFTFDLTHEGGSHPMRVCHAAQLAKYKDEKRHVLTFREMKLLMRIATFRRMLHNDPMTVEQFLKSIEFARGFGVPIVLDDVFLVPEELCSTSSTRSASAEDAATSSPDPTDEGPTSPPPPAASASATPALASS